jgi:NAD(P)-dependent dehydrogenase (short-subunit alcohol dehydrogenase family)
MNHKRRFLFVGDGINDLLAQRVTERGEQVLAISRARPSRVCGDHLTAELQTPGGWVAAVEAGSKRLGGFEVLVTCPSMNMRRVPLDSRPDDDWCAAVQEAVVCVLRGCLRALELVRQPGGVIVNLTNARPWSDDVLAAPALAAFGAVEANTHALALEAEAHRVRLFGVAPEVHTVARAPRDPAGEFPVVAFAESAGVADAILAYVEDTSAHDATYLLHQ